MEPVGDTAEPFVEDGWRERWSQLRFRRVVCLLTFLGSFPTVLISWLMLTHLGFSGSWLYMAVAALVFVWFHLTMDWGLSFPCPRCGKGFGRKWWNRDPFVRKCVHCKLPFGEPMPPADGSL